MLIIIRKNFLRFQNDDILARRTKSHSELDSESVVMRGIERILSAC